MNAITQTLLTGAAFGALATAPAMAENAPRFSLTALHAGNVVNKTRINPHQGHTFSYVFSISTYVPASDLGIAVKLGATYYKWNSYSSLCTAPKQRVRLSTKKTIYAKLGKSTETYSEGCPSGPTVFYGDTYKLKKASGEGQYDAFISSLIGKFKNSRGKYKGDLDLYVQVSIGE